MVFFAFSCDYTLDLIKVCSLSLQRFNWITAGGSWLVGWLVGWLIQIKLTN